MAQFSVEITRLPGSVLGGNQHLTTETLIGHSEEYVDPTAGAALGGGAERLGRP